VNWLDLSTMRSGDSDLQLLLLFYLKCEGESC
jgi:hypothetical protein